MLAVRGNERAAAAAGVNVAATKLQAFAISAFVAALGGAMLAYQLGTISYIQFEPIQSITILTIVVIGGIAAIAGGLVAGLIASGGVMFVLFSNAGAVGSWWTFISGVVVILNVLFVPDGVAIGVAEQARALITRGRRSTPTAAAAASAPGRVRIDRVDAVAEPDVLEGARQR
jgi:ABC-type branched-subunit amino acid transport system permease subunit